jgi:hypothetical protein
VQHDVAVALVELAVRVVLHLGVNVILWNYSRQSGNFDLKTENLCAKIIIYIEEGAKNVVKFAQSS